MAELRLASPLLAGVLLGVLYFGGLWLVVHRLHRLARPTLWLAGSAMLRMAAVLAAFSVVMDGRVERLAACLAGFLAARALLTRLARPRRAATPVGPQAGPE